MKKYVVWQNYNLDVKDWKDFLNEEYPEITNEDEQYHLICEMNNDYLEGERSNLNITIDGDILVIADIGVWNGRRIGYKELKTNNVSDCLYFESNCDYAEWYVDGYGNFKSKQSHHDGTHYLTYRAWKKDTTEGQKERLLDALYYGKVNERMIRRYTESLGKYVANVYGWKVRGV